MVTPHMVIWKSIKEIQVMFYFFGSSLPNSDLSTEQPTYKPSV